MRGLLLPLIVVAITGAGPRGQGTQHVSANPGVIVDNWIAAAVAHRPGTADPSLCEVATVSPATFEIIASRLRGRLERNLADPEARNDVLRRGAVLHTDIALLLPELAATYSTGGAAMAISVDGEYRTSATESGHWPVARSLLDGVTPSPSSDEFVRLWYRAVAATFLNGYQLGNAASHMARANEVVPRDPILLFYAGAMHEALASPRFQNVPTTVPGMARRISLPSEANQLREAERYLRAALKYGAPAEAQLRLARVMGGRGKHVEARLLLEQTVLPAGDVRLAYLRDLLLGTEQAALDDVAEARAAFERAASLFPTAQAPLIAMGDMFRRSGDRAAALDALRRLQALPADTSARADPWLDYHRSYAADAGDQLASARAWVDLEGGR